MKKKFFTNDGEMNVKHKNKHVELISRNDSYA